MSLTTRQSGEAALACLRDPHAERPDVVVLDVNMPLMSGFEVLRTIKSDPILQNMPVVMLSTSTNPADVELAYSLFASSYLVKETSFPSFLREVEDFVRYWRRCQVIRQAAD